MNVDIRQGDVLELGSDLVLRNRWFVRGSMAHPAKLHLGLLDWIVRRYTDPGDTILDPMAGIGSTLYAATLQRDVTAREIEPRWLEVAHRNASHIHALAGLFAGRMEVGQADARQPWAGRFDHIIFSPPYGCEIARTAGSKGVLPHRARQAGITLAAAAGGGLVQFQYGSHAGQIGHLRGAAYWQAMGDIYRNAHRALGSGYMVLVLKDHIRHGVRVPTADNTADLCGRLGFVLVERHWRSVYPLSLWQRRRKERGEPVVEVEDVLVFRKGVA